jgi:uncharacterized repeat protein (TIGR02543 family)
MHRSLRPAARVLLALASLLALAAIVTGPGGAATRADAPSPFDQSDNFWAWPGAVLLHVGVSPADESAGYVESDPLYIDCPFACTRPYDVGSKVVLHAYPTNGYTFTGWEGTACAGQGDPCTLTMGADTVVTANFSGHYVPVQPAAPPTGMATLHVSLQANEPISWVSSDKGGIDCEDFGVVGKCSASYPVGTKVTLSAHPFFMSYLSSWSGSATGTTNPVTVTMNGDRSVTAHFSWLP